MNLQERMSNSGEIKMIKADLHNHIQTRSRIKEKYFDKVVDTAIKRLGYNSMIGVVNFNDDRYEKLTGQRGYDRFDCNSYVYASQQGVLDALTENNGVAIVKGQEIPTKQGHLLALGLKKNVHLKSRRSLEDTIAEAKDENAIIIADHPMYFESCGDYLMKNPKLLDKIDAIEVYNGETSFGIPFSALKPGTNQKMQESFNELKEEHPNLGGVTSSDGHSLYELGRSYTTLENVAGANNPKTDFIGSLRNAIRNHRDFSKDRQGKLIGKIGAIEHYMKLAYYHGAGKIIKRLEAK